MNLFLYHFFMLSKVLENKVSIFNKKIKRFFFKSNFYCMFKRGFIVKKIFLKIGICSLFLSSAIPSIDIVLAKFFNLWKKKRKLKNKMGRKKIKHATSNKKMKKPWWRFKKIKQNPVMMKVCFNMVVKRSFCILTTPPLTVAAVISLYSNP